MKINFKRTIKVLSSFVTIVMILSCTVAMPVLAADDGIYKLSDFSVATSSDGNTVTFTYFDPEGQLAPCYRVYDDEGVMILERFSNIGFAYTPRDYNAVIKTSFDCSPFGVFSSRYSKSGFLDLSDLKAYSSFDFSIIYGMEVTGSGGQQPFEFRSLYSFYFFDENRNFVSTFTTETTHWSGSGSPVQYYKRTATDIELPEGARYLATRLTIAIYPSSIFEDDTTITFAPLGGLVMELDIDSVVENSLSMQRIESQLGDINDSLGDINQSIQEGNHKLDEIINGNDEMSDLAQDKYYEQQELESEANQAMDNIDSATDLEEILPDDAKTAEDIEKNILDWTNTNAWAQWSYILDALMQDVAIQRILLMLVAFINISVLLIGR